MKQPGLDWLLETSNPSVRFHALHDVLGRSLDDKEVREAHSRTRNSSLVRRILAKRSKKGFWPPEDTFYSPKWTASVWPMMLLGEIGFNPDEGLKNAVEKFLELHQLENGAFVCPSPSDVANYKKKHPRAKSAHWEEPCLTGNMIRTFEVFGYGEDPRVKKAVKWMPEQQLEDGGWNCNYPEKKVKHSSFMSTIEPLW